MVDLSMLTDVLEIGSVTVGAGGAFWKIFITPSKAFREDISSRIKQLEEDAIESNRHFDENYKDVSKDIQKTNDNLNDLEEDLKDHVEKIDAKNDRLLDLLLKYFSEKD